MSAVHDQLAAAGISKADLQRALNRDNWGKLVNALPIITALSAVVSTWPEPPPKPDLAPRAEIEGY